MHTNIYMLCTSHEAHEGNEEKVVSWEIGILFLVYKLTFDV